MVLIPEDTFELTNRETLSGKDYVEYMEIILKARNDPVYFIEDVLGFPGPDENGNQRHLYPVQDQIVRQFYRHKYYPDKYRPYKKMVFISGQRCTSFYSLIQTQNGVICIEDLYPKDKKKVVGEFVELNNVLIFNTKNLVRATHIIYAGEKEVYRIKLDNGMINDSSIDHKYKTLYGWKKLEEITTDDSIITVNGEIRVTEIIPLNKKVPMYDLHVPEGNAYVSNGMLTHNSGKTALISTIMAYELFELMSWENPAKHYGLMTGKSGKGATIGITCVSTSTKQANYGVFMNMQNLMKGNEWFETWMPDLVFKNEMIESKSKNVIAQVIAPKASTAAGYTNKLAVFDELDFFIESETLLDVYSVYNKVCNSTDTFKRDGKIIAISSLNTFNGIMMKEYRETLREAKARFPMSVGFNYKTWEVNPNLTEEYLRASCANDISKFLKDYANNPAASSGVQFPEGIILNRNIHNLLYEDLSTISPDILNHQRVLSLDPAWKHDMFGMACGYRHEDTIIVDGARGFSKNDYETDEAYLKPSDIRNFVDSIVEPLHITDVVCDVNNLSPELIEHIQSDLGLETKEHIPKKIDYDRWRELQEGIYQTTLDIVYDEILEKECNELLITKTQGGKAKVDHLDKKSSKDIADAVANCIWYLESDEANPFDNWLPIGMGNVL